MGSQFIVPGQPQTPWASDIDAATFALNNVGVLRVGTGMDDGSGALLQVTGVVNITGPGSGVAPYPLHIHDGTDRNFSIYGRSDGPGGLWFSSSNDANNASVAISYNASEHHWFTNAGESMVLDTLGNLTANTLNATNGFTGSGTFVNWNIVNGIVLSAS